MYSAARRRWIESLISAGPGVLNILVFIHISSRRWQRPPLLLWDCDRCPLAGPGAGGGGAVGKQRHPSVSPSVWTDKRMDGSSTWLSAMRCARKDILEKKSSPLLFSYFHKFLIVNLFVLCQAKSCLTFLAALHSVKTCSPTIYSSVLKI